MTTPVTPPPSPAPSRADPANFAARADAYHAWLVPAVAEMNAQNAENNSINTNLNATLSSAVNNAVNNAVAAGTSQAWSAAGQAQTSASNAATSAGQALGAVSTAAASAVAAATSATYAAGSANFKGNWASLTGALNMPASVLHNSQLWLLTSNLANVTTAVPGVSGSWVSLAVVTAGTATPETFGAVGNGSTDDSAQIQAFFDAITTGGLTGVMSGNKTYLLRAGVTINLGAKGFRLMGAGVESTTFKVDNLFLGATPAITIQGGASQTWPGFEIGGFSLKSVGGYNTCTAGLRVGNQSNTVPLATGLNTRTVRDVVVVSLPDALDCVHARLVRFENFAVWNDGLNVPNKALRIRQNGLSTGDLFFDRCQFKTKTTTGYYTVSMESTVSAYAPGNGTGSISGIRFQACDVYTGDRAISIVASGSAYIQDVWFEGGCQIDQLVNKGIYIESSGTSSLVENIRINSTYINEASANNIDIVSLNNGAIRDIFMDDVLLYGQGGTGVKAISATAATTGLVTGIHVDGASVVDNDSTGGAMYFSNVQDITVTGCKARRGNAASYVGRAPNYLVELAGACDEINITGNLCRVGTDIDIAPVLDNSTGTNKLIHSNNANGLDGPKLLDRAERAPIAPTLDLNFAKGYGEVYNPTTGRMERLAAWSDLITYTGANRTYTDAKGILVAQGSNVPRLTFDPVTGAGRGLSVWGARTNKILWSDDWTNAAWSKGDATVTANTHAGWDGTLLCDTITMGTNGTTPAQAITFTDGVTETISFFFRAESTANTLRICVSTASSSSAFLNTATRVFGTKNAGFSGGIVESITGVPGLYRVSIQYTPATGDGGARIVGVSGVVADNSSTADTGKTVIVCGFSCVAESTVSPYIPTTTSAVTAPADVPTITGSNFTKWFNPSEGTLVVFGIPTRPYGAVESGQLFGVSLDTNNRIFIAQGRADVSVANVQQLVSASTVVNISSGGAPTDGNLIGAAYAYKTDNYGLSANGAAAASDSSGAVPSGMTTAHIGHSRSGSAAGAFDGTIARILYFPRALHSNLQALSA